MYLGMLSMNGRRHHLGVNQIMSNLCRQYILGSILFAAPISALAFGEEVLPQADLESIRLDTLGKPVVGLGDVWHTSGGFYEVKAQVIEHLITHGTLRRVPSKKS